MFHIEQLRQVVTGAGWKPGSPLGLIQAAPVTAGKCLFEKDMYLAVWQSATGPDHDMLLSVSSVTVCSISL